MKRILLYTNQFFGQLGGESQAGVPPELVNEPIGPAILFNNQIRGGQISHVIRCGDNYYAENLESAQTAIKQMIKQVKPDFVIAGPAFNAGRFGLACADVCRMAETQLNIPSLTGLFPENPAVMMYRKEIMIASVGKSAASMKSAIILMSNLTSKVINNEPFGFPEEEGIIPRGRRINIFSSQSGAERALDMLLAKLSGQPFQSEIPIPTYQSVKPAQPVSDLADSTIALITTGGIVPQSNPFHLPAATAKHFIKLDVSAIKELTSDKYESVHAGYDPVFANQNPNRIVPLDLLKQAEQQKRIGRLHPYLFSTTGNSTSVSDATRMGQEIANELLVARVDGAILTST